MSGCLTLKKSNCRNCYKCIRHCPVKAIRFSGDQAHIIQDECIYCGQCAVVCPQNAKQIKDERSKVTVMIQSGAPVIASLDPSYIANYEGVGIEKMREALCKLGFADVEETGIGATIVKREYERILREENRDILISSACHSVNILIRRYFPKLVPYLADVISPQRAHGQDIKKRIPEAKTVFIGPCVARKDEAEHSERAIDAVLTFEQLSAWMRDEEITLGQGLESDPNTKERLFAAAGGILRCMEKEEKAYQYLIVDGIDRCMSALRDVEKGEIHHCFIEMSACAGGCVGGPVMERLHHKPFADYMKLVSYAGDSDYEVEQPPQAEIRRPHVPIPRIEDMPGKEQIRQVLRQMGKDKPNSVLNCGTCGYDTCREKAIAVCNGKADISMCLPSLTEKIEGFTDVVTTHSPLGLFVLNEDLEIQNINPAALSFFNMTRPDDVQGASVNQILDPAPFFKVKSSGKGVFHEHVYLAEYDRFAEQTIIPAEDGRMFICMIRDVTSEETEHVKREKISHQTLEVADQVIEKQMRIVQEIASLLGETAAETKVALTKLKESIADE